MAHAQAESTSYSTIFDLWPNVLIVYGSPCASYFYNKGWKSRGLLLRSYGTFLAWALSSVVILTFDLFIVQIFGM